MQVKGLSQEIVIQATSSRQFLTQSHLNQSSVYVQSFWVWHDQITYCHFHSFYVYKLHSNCCSLTSYKL